MNYVWFFIWLCWPTAHRFMRLDKTGTLYRLWWKIGYDCGVYRFMWKAHNDGKLWAYPFGNGIEGRNIYLWSMWR